MMLKIGFAAKPIHWISTTEHSRNTNSSMLLAGLEAQRDSEGRKFYLDHNTWTTTYYNDPRRELIATLPSYIYAWILVAANTSSIIKQNYNL